MADILLRTPGEPFTVADLDATPEGDGLRYELSYGALIVTPSPNIRHQRIVPNIIRMLDVGRPPSQIVLVGADVQFADDLVKVPDVLVVDESLAVGQRVMGIPNLVVEVQSPSTRMLDLTEKRSVYSSRGVPAYWLVEPDAETVTVLELDGTAYREVALLPRGELLAVTQPYPMRVDTDVVFA